MSDYPVYTPQEGDSVVLEKIEFSLLRRLSKSQLQDIRVEFLAEDISKEIEIHVRGFLWGEQLPRKTIIVPRDWWQAFKERWFPKFLKRKFPAAYTRYDVSLAVMYPNFKPKLRNESFTTAIADYQVSTVYDR